MLNHTIISDESFLSDQAIQHGMGQVFTSLARTKLQWSTVKELFFINDSENIFLIGFITKKEISKPRKYAIISRKLILQTIYVLKTEILHFLSLKSEVFTRERLLIKSELQWRTYSTYLGLVINPKRHGGSKITKSIFFSTFS